MLTVVYKKSIRMPENSNNNPQKTDAATGADDAAIVTNEDLSFENERDALKKARDSESNDVGQGDDHSGKGTLHFGEGDRADSSRSESVGASNDSPEFADNSVPETSRDSVKEHQSSEDRPAGSKDPLTVDSSEVGEAESPNNSGARLSQARGDKPEAAAPENSGGEQAGVSVSASETKENESDTAKGDNQFDQSPINGAPTDIEFSNTSVSENESGAVVATLSASDPNSGDIATFSISEDASGLFEVVGNELKLKDGASLDHEAQGTYEITVQVEDGAGKVYSETVTINVADVNEGPTDIAFSNNTVSENVSGSVVATLSASDPDAGDSAVFTLSDDASGLFEVVGNELKLKDGASLDFEAQKSHAVTVQVEDGAGHVYTETVTINVADVNEGPTDIAFSNTNVSENQAGAVVATLSSSDPDAGDSAVFTLSEDASGLFEVVGNELKLKDGASLDFEARDSYEVSVQVEDSAGNVYTETVTVNVDDVREANFIGGSDGNDNLRGTATADEMHAGTGNDRVRGGDGDDAIFGGDGNDRIRGDAGADELRGGAGDDLIYADSDDTVVDGGEGNDRVIVQGEGDFAIDMAASSVERVDGGVGNDSMDASGMKERVTQIGNGGDDKMVGGAGNDVQYGGDGDDAIFGGDGNDRIRGDAGADELRGGAGNDVLSGGDGADVFVYEMGDGSDCINGGGGDWPDTIQFSDGDSWLGEYGTDWTIELSEGSILSADEGGFTFSENADGIITLNDGSTIAFTDIEQVVF